MLVLAPLCEKSRGSWAPQARPHERPAARPRQRRRASVSHCIVQWSPPVLRRLGFASLPRRPALELPPQAAVQAGASRLLQITVRRPPGPGPRVEGRLRPSSASFEGRRVKTTTNDAPCRRFPGPDGSPPPAFVWNNKWRNPRRRGGAWTRRPGRANWRGRSALALRPHSRASTSPPPGRRAGPATLPAPLQPRPTRPPIHPGGRGACSAPSAGSGGRATAGATKKLALPTSDRKPLLGAWVPLARFARGPGPDGPPPVRPQKHDTPSQGAAVRVGRPARR